MAAEKRTRVVGYVRVSTDRQAERGQSLEVQRAKLEQYCSLFELDLVAIVEDAGQSASTLNRPGLQEVLGMLRSKQADGLLVPSLDRLTRSVRDLGSLVDDYFVQGRWSLLSVADSIDTRSAAGRLVLNVIGSVSQWERERIAERMQEGKRAKKAKGGFVGGSAPYGFELTADQKLQPIPGEQFVIEGARQLREQGLSLRAIAAVLNDAGARSRTGRAFDQTQILRMLKQESTNAAA